MKEITEYEVLTDEQIREYMKKYPMLDKTDIVLAARICYRRRGNLDKTLEELSRVQMK